MLHAIFWLAFAFLFYSFIGYGIILWLMVKWKDFFRKEKTASATFEPEVTLVVPCYNEADILHQKISNTKELEYPLQKLQIVFITDGSTDHTLDVLKKFPEIGVLHSSKRAGKTAAENRAMQHITTPVVIFSDANTLLNKAAIQNIVRHFADETVGCVAGEKRIITKGNDVANAAGEGMYWKYESFLKKLDSRLNSTVGAAGELVAFRTSLYEPMPEDTILDDFIQSMYIAAKGFRTVYEPEAYAVETAAASVKEELKRKIRICAGGWQSIQRLASRLSFRKTPMLYFQYVSHRVLRWTINPFLMILMLLINLQLATNSDFYLRLLMVQTLFYALSAAGYFLESKSLKIKIFFLPYYFCIMNYAVVIGLFRFLRKTQSAVWEKNIRMKVPVSPQ